MAWRPAPSIKALQRDLDRKFPRRTQPDWILGDADHSARVSDHNPDNKGMVHAIDIRLGGGLDPRQVLAATVGDSRVWYVIYNRKIYSRTYGFRPRTYTGSNPHTTHIHVSIRYTASAENDTSNWFGRRRRRPLVDLSNVKRQFNNAIDGRDVDRLRGVRIIQRALNKRYGEHLTTDGYVGRETLNAWGRHERRVGRRRRLRVPDRRSLAVLARQTGMFRWRR